MKSSSIIVREFFRINDLYRKNKLPLWQLSSDLEGLIEEMKEDISENHFYTAMGCAHLIEDINAVLLCENQPPLRKDKEEIINELDLIKNIILENIDDSCDEI